MRLNVSSPVVQAGILCTALACLAVPLGLLGFLLDGWVGVGAAVASGAICLAAALLALLLASLTAAPDQVVQRVVLTMLPRMGLPLFACVLVYLRGGVLVEAGFVYYIMAFYLIALLVETILLTRSKPTEPPTASRTG